MSSTLHDFNDIDPLEVREIKQIISDGTLVGWAGPSNREQNVAVSHRRRHKYGDGEQDYFRKIGGYTYDTKTLDAMENFGVERIAVLEVDNDRVLEFDLNQYRKTNHTSRSIEALESRSETAGVNCCVPVDEALYTWTTAETTILQDH